MIYYVDYISSSDNDICHVWTEASSQREAREKVENEYWDIKEIVSIRKR